MKIESILKTLKDTYIGEFVTVSLIKYYNNVLNRWESDTLVPVDSILTEGWRVFETFKGQVINVTFTTDGHDYNEVNLVIDIDGVEQYCKIWF